MITLNVIGQFVETHAVWAYVFIFIGIVIEGEIAVILAGIFAQLGSLSLPVVFFTALLGGATKSFIGYKVGMYLQRKHSHRLFLQSVERRITYFLPRFTERPFWSIFISRFFILGINWFTLIYSGYKRVAIRIFARAEALSLLMWSIGMLSIGYIFSYTALSISKDIRKFVGLILLFFLVFFVVEKIIAFLLELRSTKGAPVDTCKK